MIFETPTESPLARGIERRGDGIARPCLYAFPGKGEGQGLLVVDDVDRMGAGV